MSTGRKFFALQVTPQMYLIVLPLVFLAAQIDAVHIKKNHHWPRRAEREPG